MSVADDIEAQAAAGAAKESSELAVTAELDAASADAAENTAWSKALQAGLALEGLATRPHRIRLDEFPEDLTDCLGAAAGLPARPQVHAATLILFKPIPHHVHNQLQ